MARNSGGERRSGDNLLAQKERRNAGRPAPDARMTQLLAAAKETFTSKGFAATTMDDIAAAAGMSKKTLYKLFESKTELFRAMLLGSLPEFGFAGAVLEG